MSWIFMGARGEARGNFPRGNAYDNAAGEPGVDTSRVVRHLSARMSVAPFASFFALFGFFAPKSPGGRTCA